MSAAEVVRALGADPGLGLSEDEAKRRFAEFGPNLLARHRRPRYAEMAVRQVADPLVALLLVAAAVSLAVGEEVDAIVIGAIVLLNGALGFGQELGAERAVIALRGALRDTARVVREGREREVPARELVPGDLFVLEEGERVPADGRLVQAESLAVDEAPLTGESVPEDKSTAPVPATTPLADRVSVAYAGTAVTRGHGTAVAIATGPRAEIGRLSGMAAAAKPPTTPLQRRLRDLTGAMVVVGVGITVVLAGVRFAQGASLDDAFLLGVSVAVAAVPEGLAVTVTAALAIGARRMAARGAIVRRLPAVETLGSATTIACDKTGTLTINRLRLRALSPAPDFDELDLLRAAALASTVREVEDEEHAAAVAGDPVDRALVLAARERGLSVEGAHQGARLVRELPFDPERKRMTLVYRRGGAVTAYAKGAPEAMIAGASSDGDGKRSLTAQAEAWAREGLRVLAVSSRELLSADLPDEEIEHEQTLIGLVALQDPLRETAPAAIRSAQDAGLQVRILTGDHRSTAAAVARQLDLPVEAVSARVTPADKLGLVEAMQAQGEVVAVTGDGVNDAPALRRGDVGVAMGRSGTEAAREAADLVLTDDDFSTIVAAIREGRAIGDNVRKFVAFLLSANLGEVLLFAVAVVAGLGAPMTVVQILLVNVLTDGLPAVALADDPPSPGVMHRGPDRGDVLFGRAGRVVLGLIGMAVGAAALAAFLIGRETDGTAVAQTMAFATLALSELLVVFAVRSPDRPAWRAPRNRLLLLGVAASAAFLALALSLLREPFGTAALGLAQIGIVCALGVLPAAAIEGARALLGRSGMQELAGSTHTS
ncbi:MAG TPA: cation-transporting P-type ATPase [Solirubrobacterales bacterium]|nr:cation-transporting P-type ATPase [Solirubrobacterales bacterium]